MKYQESYYQRNKDKIKTRTKEYYHQNREVLLEESKEYYRKNKEKIIAKVECECGAVVARQYLKTHQRLKTHEERLVLNRVPTIEVSKEPPGPRKSRWLKSAPMTLSSTTPHHPTDSVQRTHSTTEHSSPTRLNSPTRDTLQTGQGKE